MKKQIEEMRGLIYEEIKKAVDSGLITWTEFAQYLTERLTEQGYSKQAEVIDEFAKKLKEAPIKCGIPLLGLPTKEEIEEYFNGIMLQVRDAIDSIAKEMKGEGR